MIEFMGFCFLCSFNELTSAEQAIFEVSKHRGPTALLAEDDKKALAITLDIAESQCHRIGLGGSVTRIQGAQRRLGGVHVSGLCNLQLMQAEIKSIRELIISELARQKFAFIQIDKHKYFEQSALFGVEVAASFPSAKRDIKEAGNCLAADLHTATVFHLMRAVEKGLRILARDRRVRLKKTPLDYAEWQNIINGIKKNVETQFGSAQRGPKRAEALEFYRGILGEFEAFKDAWRNDVTHSRVDYDEHKALSVMLHVSEFMQRLASRLSEAHIKPLAWKL